MKEFLIFITVLFVLNYLYFKIPAFARGVFWSLMFFIFQTSILLGGLLFSMAEPLSLFFTIFPMFFVCFFWANRVKIVKKDFLYLSRFFIKPPAYIADILNYRHSYFARLTDEEKAKFVERVWRFKSVKKFVPKGGLLEVTDEQKVLISSCAVQITLGLSEVVLDHFTEINLYPEDYRSHVTRRIHKGDVNSKSREISFSWKSLEFGFQHDNDALHLGIHEMAHAIKIENYEHNREVEFIPHQLFVNFDKVAQPVFDEVNEQESHFLRSYAGVNSHEFFAVSLETFFEKSIEFKEKLPELYEAITELLNQDPSVLFISNRNISGEPSIFVRDKEERNRYFKSLMAEYKFERVTNTLDLIES